MVIFVCVKLPSVDTSLRKWGVAFISYGDSHLMHYNFYSNMYGMSVFRAQSRVRNQAMTRNKMVVFHI